MDDLFYRALNPDDMEHFENREDILCSYLNNKEKNRDVVYKNISEIANSSFGHVNGSYIASGISPLISVSSDLDFVSTEYAIVQAGNFNWLTERKPIAVIKYDSKICKTVDDMREIIKSNNITDFAIDLRNDNLNRFKLSGLINGIKAFGMKYANGKAFYSDANGLSGFSTNASELLIFGRIKYDNVKFILYPVMQDLIYSCGIDVSKNYGYFFNNIDDLYSKINELIKNNPSISRFYPDAHLAVNLTDIIFKNYNKLPGNTLYEKYRLLKEEKIKTMKLIIKGLNLDWKIIDEKYHFYNIEVRNKRFIYENDPSKKYLLEYLTDAQFHKDRLIDNKVFVFDKEGIGTFDEKQKNDIVLVLSDGNLGLYSHEENTYIDSNQKVINL